MPRFFVLCCAWIFCAAALGFSVAGVQSFYIIDGDSANLRMRIFGIDAPEIGQKCERQKDEIIDCGTLAQNHLEDLLKNLRGEIRIETQGFDRHGRMLVRIFKGKTDIGEKMVAEGFAFSYRDFYAEEERAARQSKSGFWGFEKPPVRAYRWRRKNR